MSWSVRGIVATRMGAAAAAAILLGAAVPTSAPAAPPAGDPGLHAFGSCEQLLGFLRSHASRTLEERGRSGPVEMPAAGEAPSEADGAGEDFSATNVQEPGIDEPDIVKTDGRHVFALFDRRVRAVAVRGGPPRLVGTVRLPADGESMLLYRGRLLVFSHGGRVIPAGAERPRHGGSVIELDVRNPRAMRIVRTLAFDGNFVDARLHAGTARVVVSSFLRGPGLPFAEPGQDPNAVLQQSREAIARAPLSAWMPSYTLHEVRGRRQSGPLVPCREVLRGRDSDHYDAVSVLTIDLRRGLPVSDADAILMPYADVVYGSARGLYLVSDTYRELDAFTSIHKLDVGRHGSTMYSASGEIGGALLNQFSLSEHRGFLRAATTERQFSRRSESFVITLGQRAGRLRPVGRVGNLGRGETIHSVRFIGDVGYVVTFRQIDPLYTIDLSRPAQPRMVGELKLPGFSSYLHPVGRDLLLGVGRDATVRGRVLGVQVSLFDVSNPGRPRRLDHSRMGSGSSSEAEFDHHAFLYWPPARLAVIPVAYSAQDGGEPLITEMVGSRITPAGRLAQAGRVFHGVGVRNVTVRRSLIVGDRLLTVSDRGVGAADLATWRPRGFARFHTPMRPRPVPRGG